MRALAFVLLGAVACQAAPRIDNVLLRMVPPGPTSLVGARMDPLKASDVYQKLIGAQKLPSFDQFVKETGFDPRKDVNEVLFVSLPSGSVLLARGRFTAPKQTPKDMKLVRHSPYNIYSSDTMGFCVLDGTLAAAGAVPAIEAALDEWRSGKHDNATSLLRGVAQLNDQTPLWGVATGFSDFLIKNIPSANGIDFAAIFRGIQESWFEARVATGFSASIHCTAATEKDAQTLRDGAKALVGLGRLSVPDGHSELLKFWDGITAEQDARQFVLKADFSTESIDQMVQFLSTPGRGGGRGRSGGRGGRGFSGRGRGN